MVKIKINNNSIVGGGNSNPRQLHQKHQEVQVDNGSWQRKVKK